MREPPEARPRRNQNVADFLLGPGRPGDVALRGEHEEWTYRDLRRAVDRIAAHLATVGAAKGERALLLSDNSFFWVVSYLAVLRAGLVCVPLPPTITSADLQSILESTTPKTAFVQARFVPKHSATIGHLRILTDDAVGSASGSMTFHSLLASDAPDCPSPPEVDDDDLAALMFTSGSTGSPCGVMISHRNIVANTTSIIEYLKLTSQDRVMTVLPFHYCFGTSLLHTHLRVGGCLVLESRFMYPEVMLKRLAETACTGFAGVPSHFQILLRNSSITQRIFPTLRYVQQAGGSLSPSLVDELRDALPGTEVFVMYGQTEATARLSYLPPKHLDAKRGSIGKGIPGVRLRVLSEAGEDVKPGEVGEITAEGDNIAQGYWKAPDESRAHFHDGRLYTGDLATVDDEGFIYIIGRENDFLKCRGERVSCAKLEQQLLESDEIQEAAVIGAPDGVLGEAVKAFVVARAPVTEGLADRLREFCKQRMAPHLVPREVIVVPALPKSASGKILKRELAASA